MSVDPIGVWRDCVHNSDIAPLNALVHRDAVFESPVVHTPQHGHALMLKYLQSAIDVFGGPSFHFVNEWRSRQGAALEFVCELDGICVNGVDLITISEDGCFIVKFKVMVRPLKAIESVAALMAKRLASSDGLR